jgi:hypothetical protein
MVVYTMTVAGYNRNNKYAVFSDIVWKIILLQETSMKGRTIALFLFFGGVAAKKQKESGDCSLFL